MQKFNFQDILLEYPTLSSTSGVALDFIKSGKYGECFLIKANSQTNGQGRFDRKWISEDNGNIYMTLAVKEYFIPLSIISILPLYAGFIILKKLPWKAIEYKWPNDLLIRGEKFCGVLIQKFKGFFIIGIGINTESSPPGATFLKKHNILIEPKEIFESFKENLEIEVSFILEYLKKRFIQSKKITINQGEFKGQFYNINSEGKLVLKLDNGVLQTISYGDAGIEI